MWWQNKDYWLDCRRLHVWREVGQRYLLMQFQISFLHGGDYTKPRIWIRWDWRRCFSCTLPIFPIVLFKWKKELAHYLFWDMIEAFHRHPFSVRYIRWQHYNTSGAVPYALSSTAGLQSSNINTAKCSFDDIATPLRKKTRWLLLWLLKDYFKHWALFSRKV